MNKIYYTNLRHSLPTMCGKNINPSAANLK